MACGGCSRRGTSCRWEWGRSPRGGGSRRGRCSRGRVRPFPAEVGAPGAGRGRFPPRSVLRRRTPPFPTEGWCSRPGPAFPVEREGSSQAAVVPCRAPGPGHSAGCWCSRRGLMLHRRMAAPAQRCRSPSRPWPPPAARGAPHSAVRGRHPPSPRTERAERDRSPRLVPALPRQAPGAPPAQAPRPAPGLRADRPVSSSRSGNPHPAPSRCTSGSPRRRRVSCGARRCACPASSWTTTRSCPRPPASAGRG